LRKVWWAQKERKEKKVNVRFALLCRGIGDSSVKGESTDHYTKED
jgi:hypothetical protein